MDGSRCHSCLLTQMDWRMLWNEHCLNKEWRIDLWNIRLSPDWSVQSICKQVQHLHANWPYLASSLLLDIYLYFTSLKIIIILISKYLTTSSCLRSSSPRQLGKCTKNPIQHLNQVPSKVQQQRHLYPPQLPSTESQHHREPPTLLRAWGLRSTESYLIRVVDTQKTRVSLQASSTQIR